MKYDGESSWALREVAHWEETIITSPNGIDLNRTVESDYLQRFGARAPHISELFQENSKLTRSSTIEVPRDHRKLEELRGWYFHTAYKINEEDLDPAKAHQIRVSNQVLPEPLTSLLGIFSQPGAAANLLYALDLFLLHDGRLFKVLPLSHYLWVEREYQPKDWQRIKPEIIDLQPDTLARATTFLFVVGVAWRYMMLYGPRGYRHTLMDTGRLLSQLEMQAQTGGVGCEAAYNFYDDRINRILFMDGVERTTLAIITLEGDRI